MLHESIDIFPGEIELGTVVRGLAVQEGVMQPTRKVPRQQRGLDVQLIELRDRAAVHGGLRLARGQQRKDAVEHRVVPRLTAERWSPLVRFSRAAASASSACS